MKRCRPVPAHTNNDPSEPRLKDFYVTLKKIKALDIFTWKGGKKQPGKKQAYTDYSHMITAKLLFKTLHMCTRDYDRIQEGLLLPAGQIIPKINKSEVMCSQPLLHHRFIFKHKHHLMTFLLVASFYAIKPWGL